MSDTHDMLKKTAISAIRSAHADTSVPLTQTRDTLEELRDECAELILAVEADLLDGE